MNRLSPWIVRRDEPSPSATDLRRPRTPRTRGGLRGRPLPRAPLHGTAIGSRSAAATLAAPPAWLDDLRLFATGWIGGLIFFGTLLG